MPMRGGHLRARKTIEDRGLLESEVFLGLSRREITALTLQLVALALRPILAIAFIPTLTLRLGVSSSGGALLGCDENGTERGRRHRADCGGSGVAHAFVLVSEELDESFRR